MKKVYVVTTRLIASEGGAPATPFYDWYFDESNAQEYFRGQLRYLDQITQYIGEVDLPELLHNVEETVGIAALCDAVEAFLDVNPDLWQRAFPGSMIPRVDA